MQISDGHNLAIKLIEFMSGHVSSELALPAANSDLAHKYISSIIIILFNIIYYYINH